METESFRVSFSMESNSVYHKYSHMAGMRDLLWLNPISLLTLDRLISIKLDLPLFGPDNRR